MGANNLSYSAFDALLTEKLEGERFLAYDDARPDHILQPGDKILGTLTIGFGHTGRDVYIGQTSTHEQNVVNLMHDTMKAQLTVNTYVDVKLNQHEFNGLVDFVYNIGSEAFKNSTVLKLLNQSKFVEAADHLNDWVYSKGKKLAGLMARRAAEQAEFLRTDEATETA
jgi:lysozyme